MYFRHHLVAILILVTSFWGDCWGFILIDMIIYMYVHIVFLLKSMKTSTMNKKILPGNIKKLNLIFWSFIHSSYRKCIRAHNPTWLKISLFDASSHRRKKIRIMQTFWHNISPNKILIEKLNFGCKQKCKSSTAKFKCSCSFHCNIMQVYLSAKNLVFLV